MQVWPKKLQPRIKSTRAVFRRHWKRFLSIRQRLRFNEETFHLLVAGLVGIVGGLTNLFFYYSFEFITETLLGRAGDLVQIARDTPLWLRAVIPALGGLAAGLILFGALRVVGARGSTNLLEVVVAGDGRLGLRSALFKALSSLLSIATGASIGREGSITQLAATLASKGGQIARWQPYRLRLLVACGAASGMAAAYNAPVAGAVFAAQIVLGNFAMNSFAPLVFASVIASMISRTFMRIEPWYQVPPLLFSSWTQLPWFVVLGVLSGVLGAAVMRALRASEGAFNRLPLPIYLRMAFGGLLVGLLSLLYPEVWGNGYGPTNQILHGTFPVLFLAGLFAAKLAATLITVGSGAVGGMFTPTLFLGAALGSLFGSLMHGIGWTTSSVPAFALVGMGSLLAATIHSPLLAMIMIFEISVNYSIMPPLMLACVVATLTARSIHPESVYTEPLRRKGVTLDRENAQLGAAMQQTVGEIMRQPVPPVRETATFREIADRFLTTPNNFLPVVDGDQRLLGIVALQDMKEYLKAGDELNMLIAYDLMRPPPPCLTPNVRILDALPTLLASELFNVPVVNNAKEFRLVGAVLRSEALGILSQAVSFRSS